MRAPRASACSSDSRIMMPAPSPMTKPSRFLSNGHDDLLGGSKRIDIARAEQNPAMPMSQIVASAPPLIMTSASPYRMSLRDSPRAWALEAQAETHAKLGPLAPLMMDTMPEAISAIIIGIKKGLTRSE